MEFTGYMVRGSLTEVELRMAGTNGASRAALATEAKHRDALEVPDEVAIRVEDIASVRLKRASALVNGRLDIETKAGDTVRLHFRKKQAGDFDALTDALSNRGVSVS